MFSELNNNLVIVKIDARLSTDTNTNTNNFILDK